MRRLNYKKKIYIFSESRSEFFLLNQVYDALKNDHNVKYIINGIKNLKKFENNLKNLNLKKNNIKKNIKFKIEETDASSVALNFTSLFNELSLFFKKNKPDLLIVLGDRFQTLCCSMVANLFSIRILHLHGGEITKGSNDDIYRHIITKLSNFHFTSTNQYKNRVKQLGELPENILNIGSIGALNAKRSHSEFSKKKQIIKKKNIVVCVNSETNNLHNSRKNLLEILRALKKIKNFEIHFTLASYDIDVNYINSKIKKFCSINKNAKYSYSLGQAKFFKEVANSLILLGNSSSGIIEAPSLKTPTINVGNRQLGRIFGDSVFNCKSDSKLILAKINEVLNLSKKNKINYFNPYLKKNCLKLIKKKISTIVKIKKIKK